ncbi:hypothetical protein A2U01_0072926, partial [Trifolium medium]|nr:hypothetical protein [Trifolium medium]
TDPSRPRGKGATSSVQRAGGRRIRRRVARTQPQPKPQGDPEPMAEPEPIHVAEPQPDPIHVTEPQ